MKFEYETSSEDKEVVAFISLKGDLWVRSVNDCAVGFWQQEPYPWNYPTLNFDQIAEAQGIAKAFYHGDSVTITF